MNNDKFFNHYVEILNSTLQEAIGKNIIFQAQAKVSGEELESLITQNEELSKKLEEYRNSQQNIESTSHILKQREQEIETLKNDASHIETFRNQLISTKKQLDDKNSEINNIIKEKDFIINQLQEQIEYLQMTPAQKRKFDINKNKQEFSLESNDGGNF